MSGTLSQAVIDAQSSCKIYTNSSGNPASVTIHAQVLDTDANVEFSAQYSSSNVCNTCSTQLTSISKALNQFSGVACSDADNCFCGFHFVPDTWHVTQNFCDTNGAVTVCPTNCCMVANGRFLHVCVTNPTCAIACFGDVKPMHKEQTLRTCRLCCMYQYSWDSYFDGQVSRNQRSPLISTNGENKHQYLLKCCGHSCDSSGLDLCMLMYTFDSTCKCNCYPNLNCLQGLHCTYIKGNFACTNGSDYPGAFGMGTIRGYDNQYFAQDIWHPGGSIIGMRINDPGSCQYTSIFTFIPCSQALCEGFRCGCIQQAALVDAAYYVMGCCYWCCCTCMCQNDIAKANFKPAKAGCGMFAMKYWSCDSEYIVGYGSTAACSYNTETVCAFSLLCDAFSAGTFSSTACCKLKWYICMSGECTGTAHKWLWHNPYDGKNYSHIINSNPDETGIFTWDLDKITTKYLGSSIAGCCICCANLTEAIALGLLTKVADNPSVFSGRTVADIPSNPYLIGKECWAIWWPCFCCNQEKGLWNGCWERYTSGDLISWTKTEVDGIIATRTNIGNYPSSLCTVSTTTTGSGINDETNHYFNGTCLNGTGTLEFRADINRLERTGIVLSNGDNLYINNGGNSKLSVQVWGYDD